MTAILPRPPLTDISLTNTIMLGYEGMSRHMTDEGTQLQAGFAREGFSLWGKRYACDEVNVKKILEKTNPGIVVVQDKREWDGGTAHRMTDSRFVNCEELAKRTDIFKVTILKDSHARNAYHSQAAKEIGCHAWLVYYNIDTVCKLAPFLRKRDCIRIYHSVDFEKVPNWPELFNSGKKKDKALVSGAVAAGAYPLRFRIIKGLRKFSQVEALRHPGYAVKSPYTNEYLKKLSQYKVAICTASKYDYALRKIIEATACGCVVITDLSTKDYLPHIHGNLIRVSSDISDNGLNEVISDAINEYDFDRQVDFADNAQWYDYRLSAQRMVASIKRLREKQYNDSTPV